MALTQDVKAELAVLPIVKHCCRRAEIATMLRYAGGLHITGGGNIMVEAEFDTGAAARRLRVAMTDVFGLSSDLITVRGSGLRRGTRYLVRLVKDGPAIARLTGLIDAQGRPVRGLPAGIVGGAMCDAVAAWRGAFLAHGCLTEPGRSMAMEVTAPGQEAAMALVGAARRLGVSAKVREVRGLERVVIRDGESIAIMLTKMGAHETRLVWEDRRLRREVRASANRLANFDDANLRRSARAAVTASARVSRAFEILGDEVPEHLRAAGCLRIDNQQASLEELGALHEPPLTKDAIAGRIRRLLALADKKAQELGLESTDMGLSLDDD
ncbi:MAG: DNA-binding protein WhiA [Propionibacteriaceae bacterium]|jgi:DNA-binding protein WhiA|nr:DNA-binding protein WhiA [Propionibacteriaceae bacterium]